MSMLAPAASPSRLLSGIRRELYNWWFIAPYAALVEPSRFPPRQGFGDAAWLRRRALQLRFRNGMRAQCHSPELWGFIEVFVRRDYDIPGFDWSRARNICDVGANVGMATLWFASVAPRARIVAVEPSSTAHSVLADNVGRNGLSGRVSMIRAALGAQEGTAMLQMSRNSLLGRVVNTGEPGDGKERVDARTLESVLDDHHMTHVDVLKLDCEGAEYDIVLAPGKALERVENVVGEYHRVPGHRPGELFEALQRAGFTIVHGAFDTETGWFRARRTGA